MLSRRPYKGGKLDENALTPCRQCDCLILSDSSDPNTDKCIRIKKTPKDKNISPNLDDLDDDDKTSVPKTPSVRVSIKVISDDESVDKATSSTERDNRVEATQTDNNKHLCFKFCRKKKKEEAKPPPRDERVQTAHIPIKNTKIQSSDVDLDDFVNNCTKFGKPLPPPCGGGGGVTPGQGGGGCNTNTIIFQKDQASGDGIASLENWLKMEARTNARNLEDILGELHRQKREIQEMKDMLDTIVRGLRDQLFKSTFGKGGSDPFADVPHQYTTSSRLERKSNTLSMKGSNEADAKNSSIEPPFTKTSKEPEVKKKRRFFSWCP